MTPRPRRGARHVRMLLAALVTVPLAALAVLAPPAAAAAPLTSAVAADAAVDSIVYWPTPYLATGYGPLAQAVEVSGGWARGGAYSPMTGGWSPSGPWYRVVKLGYFMFEGNAIRGHHIVSTPYGDSMYATLYKGSRGQWGVYNLVTQRFYPTGAWHPLA